MMVNKPGRSDFVLIILIPMASLTIDSKGRSPYWVCCYTASNGRRLKKSTKVRRQPLKGDTSDKGKQKTVNEARFEAEEICRAIERAEQLAGMGDATEVQFRKILHNTLERVGRGTLRAPSTKEWLEEWLKGREGMTGERTMMKYRQVVTAFLESLASRSSTKLQNVAQSDVINFRNTLLVEGRTPQTVDGLVRKILNIPFALALRVGILQVNPIASLPALKSLKVSKGVFTSEQISDLVRVADGNWKGLILAGFYTGARLQDLVHLKWENVDLALKTITFRQRKTGEVVVSVIHPSLEEYFMELPGSDSGEDYVFPALALIRGTGRSGLSMQFKSLMNKAGIASGVARIKQGDKGRNLSSLSFHSLRHSFNSELANAGVSQEIRRKLTGHATVAANNTYTHHDLEIIRTAITLIPRVPGNI